MDVKKTLKDYKISPEPLKDQFFLTDDAVIEKIVDLADLAGNDVVLEIGAGVGNITRELAKKAGRVIAFEIDKRFRPILSKLPNNVDVRYENAFGFIQLGGKFKKRREYNKVVSNLPFSLCEPLLHNLTFLEYDKVILLVPKKFTYTIEENPIFSSFFRVKRVMTVDKIKFYPKPKTDSAVIDLIRLPDPIRHPNLPLFLKQYLYQHEGQKVKNALMEGIIHFARLTQDKRVTKNQARGMVEKSGLNRKLLDSLPINSAVYEQIGRSF